jgi:hypothetical protein
MTVIRVASSVGRPLLKAEGKCLPVNTAHIRKGPISLAFQSPAESFTGVLNAAHVENIAVRIANSHADFSGNIRIVEIGKSPGENPAAAPQPILGIEVLPGGPINRTAFFCAGHHTPEYAGAHANLHLLDQLLINMRNPASAISRLFSEAALVFMPLANPDGAVLTSGGEFGEYSIFGSPVGEDNRVIDNNAYITYHPKAILTRESQAIKRYIESFTARFGRPFFALDFHESKNYIPSNESRKNRYLFAPLHMALAKESDDGRGIDTSYTVCRDIIDAAINIFGDIISNLVISGKPKTKFSRQGQQMVNFIEMMHLMGASSYLIETPNNEKYFHVGDRVMLAMLATEMILEELI